MAASTCSVDGAPPKLAVSDDLPLSELAGAPQAIELRHLRYFVALADAGSFTHAAEPMFIAQPTMGQQIRRLEEIAGAPLLQRRREELRLTRAGAVLLEASRTVLSLVDHEVNRTRPAAGLGRARLRVAVPAGLPDALAVHVGRRPAPARSSRSCPAPPTASPRPTRPRPASTSPPLPAGRNGPTA